MFRVAVLGRLTIVLFATGGLAWLLLGSMPASTTEHTDVLTLPGDLAPHPAGSSGPPSLMKAHDSTTATGESSEEAAATAAPDDPAAVRRESIQRKLEQKRAERAKRREAKDALRALRRARRLARDESRSREPAAPAATDE